MLNFIAPKYKAFQWILECKVFCTKIQNFALHRLLYCKVLVSRPTNAMILPRCISSIIGSYLQEGQSDLTKQGSRDVMRNNFHPEVNKPWNHNMHCSYICLRCNIIQQKRGSSPNRARIFIIVTPFCFTALYCFL